MLGRLVIRPYAAHSSVWTTVLGSVCCLIMYNLETEQHYTASPCIQWREKLTHQPYRTTSHVVVNPGSITLYILLILLLGSIPITLRVIGIERKLKHMKGCHRHQLPSYLDEFMWMERWGGTNAFNNIILCTHISTQYPV